MEKLNSNNAFDFIRLVSALAVLFGHSYSIYYGVPEVLLLNGSITLGSLAVNVFFAVSGFLICQSWERDPNPFRFTVRRSLRILPGLVIMSLFTTFVIGLLATRLQTTEYLMHSRTWSYLVSNITMICGVISPPGVFESKPYIKAANGSLWTLRYEVMMYAMLVIFGLTRHLRMACVAAFSIFSITYVTASILDIGFYKLPIPLIWKFGLEIDLI